MQLTIEWSCVGAHSLFCVALYLSVSPSLSLSLSLFSLFFSLSLSLTLSLFLSLSLSLSLSFSPFFQSSTCLRKCLCMPQCGGFLCTTMLNTCKLMLLDAVLRSRVHRPAINRKAPHCMPSVHRPLRAPGRCTPPCSSMGVIFGTMLGTQHSSCNCMRILHVLLLCMSVSLWLSVSCFGVCSCCLFPVSVSVVSVSVSVVVSVLFCLASPACLTICVWSCCVGFVLGACAAGCRPYD